MVQRNIGTISVQYLYSICTISAVTNLRVYIYMFSVTKCASRVGVRERILKRRPFEKANNSLGDCIFQTRMHFPLLLTQLRLCVRKLTTCIAGTTVIFCLVAEQDKIGPSIPVTASGWQGHSNA